MNQDPVISSLIKNNQECLAGLRLAILTIDMLTSTPGTDTTAIVGILRRIESTSHELLGCLTGPSDIEMARRLFATVGNGSDRPA